MPRFQFRLETLLKLRRSERQQKRQELAEAYHAEEMILDRVTQWQREQEDTRQRSRVEASPGAVSVDRLLDSQRYEAVLRSTFQQLQAQQDTIREEIERRRQTLVEADRAVRVLEKLKEKQHAEHLKTEEAQERKRLDEVALRPVRHA